MQQDNQCSRTQLFYMGSSVRIVRWSELAVVGASRNATANILSQGLAMQDGASVSSTKPSMDLICKLEKDGVVANPYIPPCDTTTMMVCTEN